MIREGPFKDIIAIDLRGSGDGSSPIVPALFVQDIGPSQKVHHALDIRVSGHVGLRIGDRRATSGPPHSVAHEVDRSFENILSRM